MARVFCGLHVRTFCSTSIVPHTRSSGSPTDVSPHRVMSAATSLFESMERATVRAMHRHELSFTVCTVNARIAPPCSLSQSVSPHYLPRCVRCNLSLRKYGKSYGTCDAPSRTQLHGVHRKRAYRPPPVPSRSRALLLRFRRVLSQINWLFPYCLRRHRVRRLHE